MEYTIKKTDLFDPPIDSAEWNRAETGFVDKEPWPGYAPASIPRTSFKLLRGKDGISILMHTDETDLRADVTEENGEVCEDSCMEFFFKPDPYDVNYMNFEINPKGVMHVGLGKDRFDRLLIDEPRSTFRIETQPLEGNWSIKYYIPDSFLLRYFKQIAPVCRANFYKCGDKTSHSHYGVWNMVETVNPDYHVADFFGKIRIEK